MSETRKLENRAISALLRIAVEFDQNKKYTEALQCYTEGIQLLIDLVKGASDEDDKCKLRSSAKGYMTRAETLKKLIAQNENDPLQNKPGFSENLLEETNVASHSVVLNHHQQIIIENDSIGHSYKSVFGKFLTNEVSEITVEDPYIRLYHQCHNFLRFCELAIENCWPHLKRVNLMTAEGKPEQVKWLDSIRTMLNDDYGVHLYIEYSPELHDREIRLNNGWVIQIGRGLDYFKKPKHDFEIGCHNMDLRKCHKTNVDIFHKNIVKKSYG